MPSPIRFLIALLGCLHLCGGHYGVLQGIAWTQMLIRYSAEEGWIEGAKQTFDGEHPCGLCVAISEAKQNDSSSDAPSSNRRGVDTGLELKPCPLPKSITLASLSAFGVPPSGLAKTRSSIPRLPSAPEPPPPRRV